MSEFCPFFTNDGSVGLYNKDFDDIYHSVTGALSESYEKFILPSHIDKLLKNDSIKVLDICYGIGYNTKSFLNYIYEKKFFEIKSTKIIDSIYTDKSSKENNIVYNDTICSDNNFASSSENYKQGQYKKNKCNTLSYVKNKKVYIKAIDNDQLYIMLSPFIKSGAKHFSNSDLKFDIKRIEKYLNRYNNVKYKISPVVNYILYSSIFESGNNYFKNNNLENILFNKNNSRFFDRNIRAFYEFLVYKYDYSIITSLYHRFLHNIYYKYIAMRYKNIIKTYQKGDLSIEFDSCDARSSIINDKNTYDLIYLDAFTPSKCPCLWSYEFFSLLHKKLNNDGMLLTYSSSAAVRSAMIESGFYIGYSYKTCDNKFVGTVCSKNSSLIKYPISEFDLGLLKTKAGIFYRDKNLNGQNEAIIACRNFELENSDRESSSHYINRIKKGY